MCVPGSQLLEAGLNSLHHVSGQLLLVHAFLPAARQQVRHLDGLSHQDVHTLVYTRRSVLHRHRLLHTTVMKGKHDGRCVCNVAEHAAQAQLQRVHLSILTHPPFGEDVQPVAVRAQPLGHERQDGLRLPAAAHNWERLARQKKLRQEPVAMANVVRAKCPAHAAVTRLGGEQAQREHRAEQRRVVQRGGVVGHGDERLSRRAALDYVQQAIAALCNVSGQAARKGRPVHTVQVVRFSSCSQNLLSAATLANVASRPCGPQGDTVGVASPSLYAYGKRDGIGL